MFTVNQNLVQNCKEGVHPLHVSKNILSRTLWLALKQPPQSTCITINSPKGSESQPWGSGTWVPRVTSHGWASKFGALDGGSLKSHVNFKKWQ